MKNLFITTLIFTISISTFYITMNHLENPNVLESKTIISDKLEQKNDIILGAQAIDNNAKPISPNNKTIPVIKPIEIKKSIPFDFEKRTLKLGQTGEDVYFLNYVLKQLGYSITNINYSFSNETAKSVKSLQLKHKLTADGIIGANTYKALSADISSKNIKKPTISLEIKGKTPQGKWIFINKSNNTLYYMNKNTILEKHHVATGLYKSYTPEGKFFIVNKIINPTWGGGGYTKAVPGGASNNPLGKRWMGLDIGGGGSYGIHGNTNEGSIGTYASHGCIRMANKEVEIFFSKIEKKTPVWIGSEEKLKGFGILFIKK